MDRFTFYTLAFFEKLNMYDNASLSRYMKIGIYACYNSMLESLSLKLEYQYNLIPAKHQPGLAGVSQKLNISLAWLHFNNIPLVRLLLGLWCCGFEAAASVKWKH